MHRPEATRLRKVKTSTQSKMSKKYTYILHLKLEIQARSDANSEAFADRSKLKEVTAFLMWMTDTSK